MPTRNNSKASWVLWLGYWAVCPMNHGSIRGLERLHFTRIQRKGHESDQSSLSKVQVKDKQRNAFTLLMPLWCSLKQHNLYLYKY
jgi:hypothetical protein